MLEDLKYALINNCEQIGFTQFLECPDSIMVICDNIVLNGVKNEISVYCDCKEMVVFEESKYLTEINTIKSFYDIYPAINYFKYLIKVQKDIKYELYHYFLFKIKMIEIKYDYLQFNIVNENAAIRCDISGLKISTKPLFYNFVFISKANGLCELIFYPEQPLWDEGKICPESTINGIVNYIYSLGVDNYFDIPLQEV